MADTTDPSVTSTDPSVSTDTVNDGTSNPSLTTSTLDPTTTSTTPSVTSTGNSSTATGAINTTGGFNLADPGFTDPAQSSFTQLLQQQIEVFQLGVFDDDLAAAAVVLDVHLESQRALQALLHFADVGVKRSYWLGFLLYDAFRMKQTLDVTFCLTNRKRKSGDALRCLLHLLVMFEGQQSAGVAKTEFAFLHTRLYRRG